VSVVYIDHILWYYRVLFFWPVTRRSEWKLSAGPVLLQL